MNKQLRYREMTKLLGPALGLLLSLTLIACNGQTSTPDTSAASNSRLSADYEGALLPIGQLAVGTFRLEEQELAVTAEQAQQLAPLWRAYRSVSNSASASRQEVLALQKQIEEAMTDEQLAAIQAMRLTNADLAEVMAEQGVKASNSGDELAEERQETLARIQAGAGMRNSSGGGGGMPGGGAMPGGGGGMPPSGGEMPPTGGDMGGAPAGVSPDQTEGGQGSTAATSATVPTALLGQLIALLESK